jgi:hypothetical protein
MNERIRRASGRTKIAVAAVVVACALAVAYGVGIGGNGQADDLLSGSPIRVDTALAPRTHLFGDTVTARINVATDSRRVEADSVRMNGSFGAYKVVAPPIVERRQGNATEYVVWRVRLRCLTSACVAGRAGRRFVFPRVRVGYSLLDGDGDTARVLSVGWPALTAYSRIDRVEVAGLDPRGEPPWRADLAPLPDVSYRQSPLALAALLFGVGGLLILGAAALVAPRIRPEIPERAPVAVPVGRRLTPFEQALLLLESDSAPVDSRRKALERVGGALGHRGASEEQVAARQLAWSREPPANEATRALAQRVRCLDEGSNEGMG